MTTSIVRAACPHDCPDTCALLVTVEDGVATEVKGDPDHPTTAGVLCTKVARYAERTYHPERLLHPMRRVGKKGEGKFERISWDQALDEIGERLGRSPRARRRRSCRTAIAGTMGLVQGESMSSRFFNQLGASHAGPHHLRHRPASPATNTPSAPRSAPTSNSSRMPS